jgi:SMI1/KNR4 family protein SUKH-1
MRPGATDGALRRFEHRYKNRLPQLVRDYFMVVDGFGAPHDQDDEGFRFWPLDEVQPVSTYDRGRFGSLSEVFLFADYMGFSWGYGVTLHDPSAPVHMIGSRDGAPKLVAPSFEEFLDRYICDDPSIYG